VRPGRTREAELSVARHLVPEPALRSRNATPPDPAAPAGLVYVTDEGPGIARRRSGKGFSYHTPSGQCLRDRAELDRIRRLAIPPAYTRVWICPRPDGHLQATGRDARGRKQYRYHADWRIARDTDKFTRMAAFGEALPRIRARVRRDLEAKGGGVPRDTLLATLVRLLDTTLVRVGNDVYARENGSYGLTTLKTRHAQVNGAVLKLRFKGKSGVVHEVALEDPRVARIVRRCQSMPGQELFQYTGEDGAPCDVSSQDVNDYLRDCTGEGFTAKDFRTWHASALALGLLAAGAGEPATKQGIVEVLTEVARRLGNTVAVCRKSYVHPDVVAAAASGELGALMAAAPARVQRRGLSVPERQLLCFLAGVCKPRRRR
jgi:DNA topoisomerase-1